MKEKIKSYAFFILTTLAVGGLAALLTRNNMSSFEQLEKGPVDVPAIVFPIVWTVLYILMGISAATVFKKSREMGEYSVPALRTYVHHFLQYAKLPVCIYLAAFAVGACGSNDIQI